MPMTRRQYADWVNSRGPNYETSQEEECEECSQRSSQGSQASNSFSFGEPETGRRSESSYSENDRCKRHRRRDDEPYVHTVSSYRRRAPKE